MTSRWSQHLDGSANVAHNCLQTDWAMQPGTARLATGLKAFDHAATRGIDRDTTHVVVHDRPQRDRIERRTNPGHPAERADHQIACDEVIYGVGVCVDEDAMSLRQGGA